MQILNKIGFGIASLKPGMLKICFPRRSNYAYPGSVGIISAIGIAPQNLQQD